MSDKFLVGVATADAYDSNNNVVFTSKTMTDNTIAISASNKPITGGTGNMQLYIYYHTSKMTVNLTETQFNLNLIAATLGSDVSVGDKAWTEEVVILGEGGTGIVQGTPIVSPDADVTIYGWVLNAKGVSSRVTFTGKNFTVAGAQAGDKVDIKYYENYAAAQSVEVPANIVPDIVRLVFNAQEASNKAGSGIIGRVEVEIPQLQLDGSVTLGMKSSDVVSLAIKGNALAYSDDAFSNKYYAKIKEIITGANWYDNALYLASTTDPVDLDTTHNTFQLDIRAITNDNKVIYLYPDSYPDLTFTSSTPATATVDASGLITRVAAGSTVINVKITSKPEIQTDIDVTVV